MLAARSFTEPEPGHSVIHRLDSRAKIIVLMCFSLIALTLDKPRSLAVLMSSVALCYLIAGIPWRRIRVVIGAALLIAWGTMFSQALFYAQEPRTVIAILLPANAPVLGALTKGIYVYQEGLVHGAVQSMRIVSMFALGLLFAWTTDPRDALYGLIGLGVPYGMAFMVITALRFLPVLLAEVAVVVSAQRLRGLDARSLLPTAALRTPLLVLKPTLSNCLRRAGTLTLSVQSRAFDPGADRTYIRGFAWSPGTVLLVGVIVTLTLAIVTTKIIYLLYYNDVLYRSEWRTLYGWARIYL